MNDFDENDEPSFFQHNRIALIVVGLVAVAGGALTFKLFNSKGSSPRREPAMVMVSLPPPLPTPPPPPQQQQPPPEQKMVEQQQVMEPESKPEENKPEPPKPPDEPPANLGTGVKGDGAGDGFGLGGSGNGGMIGGGNGNGRGGGSKWGWYAGQVQTRIAEALRENRRTRSANIASLQVRIWPDASGRITRASLAGSTGDASVDAAIKNEVLAGLQLSQPPPAGMPTPIVLRVSARRPN